MRPIRFSNFVILLHCDHTGRSTCIYVQNTQRSELHVYVIQVRQIQITRLQDSQQIKTACLLPFDFSRLVEGIGSGMCTELDDVQEQIEGMCREAAEKLAQDLGTGMSCPTKLRAHHRQDLSGAAGMTVPDICCSLAELMGPNWDGSRNSCHP